jgi:methylaspartate mutase sigma subunit
MMSRSDMDPVTVVVSSTASDSHMWNLVYLQLLLEELGCAVTNLGACVPDDMLVERCRAIAPNLVVLSTVNGHGRTEGLRVAPKLRACPDLAGTYLVIGGKLGTDDELSAAHRDLLLAAGFDGVFDDGDVPAFCAFLDRLATRVVS